MKNSAAVLCHILHGELWRSSNEIIASIYSEFNTVIFFMRFIFDMFQSTCVISHYITHND